MADINRLDRQSPSRRGIIAAAGALPLGASALASVAIRQEPSGNGSSASAPGVQSAPPEQSKPDYILNIENKKINPLRSPGGNPYPAVLTNGEMPGTEMRYKEGDSFRVLVNNRLLEPTTLHWHGMLVPNLQDGVPEITQAPIEPGNSIFYEFPIRQSGTYWYHSHVGLQEQQGLAGPLIIEPRVERHPVDHDFVVFLQDWINTSPYEMIPEIRNGIEMPGQTAGDSWTQNRVHMLDGKPWEVDVYPAGMLMNGQPTSTGPTFHVKKGDRVRLRIIDGATSTFFRVQLAGHKMTVIATDSQPCVPVEVDNFIFGPGERYDVLVDITEDGAWELQAAGMGTPHSAIGTIRTSHNKKMAQPNQTFGKKLLTYDMLRSPYPTTLPEGPVKTFTLDLGGDMKNYLWSMGGEYFKEAYVPNPDAAPLEIESGDRVRVIMPNKTKMAHPMHLHGHFFRAVPEGTDWDTPNLPMKDTLISYTGDTSRFEFTADNPGNWFFHCHNLYHLAAGMAREFRYTVKEGV